jgi:hypothetical protein
MSKNDSSLELTDEPYEYDENGNPKIELAELCTYWVMDKLPSKEWLRKMSCACGIRIVPILKSKQKTVDTFSKPLSRRAIRRHYRRARRQQDKQSQ